MVVVFWWLVSEIWRAPHKWERENDSDNILRILFAYPECHFLFSFLVFFFFFFFPIWFIIVKKIYLYYNTRRK